jgi:hypothetical protein
VCSAFDACYTASASALVCRYKNGRYPYPFMNKMHPAAALAMMSTLSLIVLQLMSTVGAALAIVSNRAFSKPGVLYLDAQGVRESGKTEQLYKNGLDGPVLQNGKNGRRHDIKEQ